MAQQLFDLLKKDHRQVEKMMKEIAAAPVEEREDLFPLLRSALSEHLQIEEKHFYPKLKGIGDLKELVQDALEEHKEAKDHLLELEEMDSDAPHWQETFKTMQEGILHHVQDEEKKVFPKCSQHFSEQQLQEIADHCVKEKEKSQPSRKAARGGQAGARKQPRA